MAINVPLLAGGQAGNQGLRAGQDFVKGLSDLKTAKANRAASAAQTENVKQNTKINKQTFDENQKKIDMGLIDAQNENAMSQAQIQQINFEALQKVYKENPDAAEKIAKSGIMLQAAETTAKLDAANNESLISNINLFNAGALSYDELKQTIENAPGMAGIVKLPDDEVAGKHTLKLLETTAPQSLRFRQEMALKAVASQSSGYSKLDPIPYEAGQVRLNNGTVVPAKQLTRDSSQGKGGQVLVEGADGTFTAMKSGTGQFFTAGQGSPDKSETASKTAFLKMLESPERLALQAELHRGIDSAKAAILLSETVFTGTGVATITDLRGIVSTIAHMVGMDSMVANIANINDERTLEALAFKMLAPAMVKYGKSFTDFDSKNEQRTIAGLQHPADVNAHLANVFLYDQLYQKEYMAFENMVGGLINSGVPDAQYQRAERFAQYMKDFPRSEIKDGKFTTIVDDEGLWAMYASGVPTKWQFGSNEYTIEQIHHAAKEKGVSVREAMKQNMKTYRGVRY